MAEQQPAANPSTQEQSEQPTYGIWISYKIDTWTRIRSSLYSIARFFRIMPARSHSPTAEFSNIKEEIGFADVEGFYTSLSNFYKSAATCSIDPDRNRWKVTKISAYKSNRSVEHESVVADVVCGKTTVYLRIERKLHLSVMGGLFRKNKKPKSSSNVQTSGSEPDSDAHPHNNPPPAPPPRSLSKIVADQISYSQHLSRIVVKSEEACVEAIEFKPGKGLTLPQIAVLARAVNSMGQTYNLFAENCYWFAHVMIEAAKMIGLEFKETTNLNKRGTWGGGFLTTKKPTPELIAEAKSKYDEAWVAFDKDIYDTINNPNSEIYQQALVREEQERKKRQEAELLKDEERRKRQEAERAAAKQAEEIKQLKALLAARDGATSSSS